MRIKGYVWILPDHMDEDKIKSLPVSVVAINSIKKTRIGTKLKIVLLSLLVRSRRFAFDLGLVECLERNESARARPSRATNGASLARVRRRHGASALLQPQQQHSQLDEATE